MSKIRKEYSLNPETLMYEIAKVPLGKRLLKIGVYIATCVAVTVLYFWLYAGVLKLDPPKTAWLKRENAAWNSKLELMNRQLDIYEEQLADLNLRNDDIYRSIFGMNEIPPEVLNAGFGGVNRYAELDEMVSNSLLRDTYERLDVLAKRSYVQSKSFDEVAELSRRAGEMASCIPAIPPIDPKPGTYHLSSPFGTREDPVYGGMARHTGQDIASHIGNPVYATGDGVVEKVDFKYSGYGNEVVIDHGFGYKTRYAHLNTIDVGVGQNLHRGDKIGEVGKSGKSTGPHLHYEVLYKGNPVNPMSYMDMDMPVDEYKAMIGKRRMENQTGSRPSAASLGARQKRQGTNGRQ